MRLCPNCGNQNDDTGKYCACCGCALYQARPGVPVPDMPDPEMPVYTVPAAEMPVYTMPTSEMPAYSMPACEELPQNTTPTQPLWVTEHYDLSSENDIEKSLTYPLPDKDPASEGNSSAPRKYSAIYHDDTQDVDDADIFDEIADSASFIYSMMPRKARKWVLAMIIGTLLSIIPFIYVSCTHQAIPTLDNLIGVTTSQTTP